MKKWFTLSFLSLAFFFYMSDRALFGLLVIPIQESTGLSDIQIGLVDTAMFWVYAAIVPFAGVLGGR
jgi:MFS family permease